MTFEDDENYKEIRVTIEMDGTKYGYRQHVPLEDLDNETAKNYTAYAIASTIQATIIENWDKKKEAN